MCIVLRAGPLPSYISEQIFSNMVVSAAFLSVTIEASTMPPMGDQGVVFARPPIFPRSVGLSGLPALSSPMFTFLLV